MKVFPCHCKSATFFRVSRGPSQGVVIPIGAVVTAATGVKGCFWCRSSGQGQFSNLVTAVKMLTFLRVRIAHSVVKCVRSNGQGPICGAVKRSSNKNDGQNFLTPVAAVTTAPIGVTTPCESLLGSVKK